MSERIVVMGVSGAGKTAVGARLAAALSVPFFDADAFHSPENIAKMAAGEPLTDDDRQGWLEDLADLLQLRPGMVLACSALKRRYREVLGRAGPRFIYLRGDFDTIRSRLVARPGHYFKGDHMLRSQFAALEPPDPREIPHVSVDADMDQVLASCLRALGR